MPLHVPPISRRSFLVSGAAAAAGVAVFRSAWGAPAKSDPNRFALLADTHIPEREDVTARGVNMTDNLKRVVAELTAQERKVAGVIVNGDCAYLKGLPDDYANLARCVGPLAEADLPLHLTMGNHDDRGPFYAALAGQRPEKPPVEAKHVSVIESPHANWFLLDSLFEVNVVTGELGQTQLAWLARALDERPDKPAIVVAHHNPQFEANPSGTAWTGMKDAAALFDLLDSRKQVKAYVFGHTHNWSIGQRGGIHLVNLPPVAYVFGQGKPNGWLEARMTRQGVQLELHTLDAEHPQSGEKVELAWR